MAIIIHIGDTPMVKKQLICKHDWHGPCIDDISRFYRCKECWAYDRDISNIKEYWEAVKNINRDNQEGE